MNEQVDRVELSVVLATYNEADNLGKCLEAIKDIANEIVIVDGESTDNTVEIAKRYGARVILTTNKANFHINKQMAMDEARGEWVLQLDADEVVDNELKTFIQKVAKFPISNYSNFQKNEVSAYFLRRKNYFLGRFLTKGGQYPDMVIRFYKKGKAILPQKDVHEQMKVDGKVGVAEGHLLHFNAPNFSRYITNANRYTSLTAKKMLEDGVKLNFINDIKYLFWQPIKTFGWIYFRHKGVVDGLAGFVFAWFSGLHFAIAYMKLGDLIREKALIDSKIKSDLKTDGYEE